MQTLTTYNEIFDKVVEDYHNDSVELNSLFFDFNVKLSVKELLQVYTDLQSHINGDSVLHLENPYIEEKDDTDNYIWGVETECTDTNLNDIYEGNMKDFLESYNGNELETGWCRVMDICENPTNENLTGGIKLDFIF